MEKGFWNFGKMVSVPLTMVLYVIGVGVIFVAAFVFAGRVSGFLSVLVFGGVLVFGQLSWRLTCEISIVMFKIHEEINEINYALRYHSNASIKQLQEFNQKGRDMNTYEPQPKKEGYSHSILSKMEKANMGELGKHKWMCSCGSENVNSDAQCSQCGKYR